MQDITWAQGEALPRFLNLHVGGFQSPIVVTPLRGGQSNPTFVVSDADGRRVVLRKKPQGTLLPSAHAVDREFRVMKALAGTDVPVPQVLGYCKDPSVIGTPFYVMAFVEGRTFWDPALPGLLESERTAVYDDMNRVVAALHAVDPAAVGLADYGPSKGFFERQIRRWTQQYSASATAHIPEMDRLAEWLPQHVPVDGEPRVYHGDLRIDNLLFHPTKPRVVAVLDWELSTLGHPLADFAHHALAWRLTSEQFRGMADRPIVSLGIPSEVSYLHAYARRTGCPIARHDYEFCVSFALFRLAAILQGIFKRALDGTASGQEALDTGRKGRTIAELAWKIASSR